VKKILLVMLLFLAGCDPYNPRLLRLCDSSKVPYQGLYAGEIEFGHGSRVGYYLRAMAGNYTRVSDAADLDRVCPPK
jgi:hypothetical protein